MTREQIEQELETLEWEKSACYSNTLEAETISFNFDYLISKGEDGYTLKAENWEQTINTTIATGVKTEEEAKLIAWDDYIDRTMRMFK
jgi:hypothetical protein|nr:MAG TPA: hypothetical protein [Crassvirales sp.]